MRTITKAILAALALAASALPAVAQDNNNPNGSNPGGPPRGHRPPPPAIIGAIDANHDGVIDADEIANAAATLQSLDKNGDGVLTPDEFVGRHPRPPMDSPDANVPRGGLDGPPDAMQPGPPPDGN